MPTRPKCCDIFRGWLTPFSAHHTDDLHGYALLAAVYSTFVFTGEASKDGPLIFSKRNARSIFQVLLMHGAYLVSLLCILQIASGVVPRLPFWMTDTFAVRGSRVSFADILFALVCAVMCFIERRKLYVKYGPEIPESGPKPSESSTREE